MNASRSTIQMLESLSNSSNYCQRIELNTIMGHLHQFKCEYELMSNPIQIIPPCVWFAVEEGQCLSSIHNDIEKSRISREGLLSTIQKGNLLNRINYHELQEDMGTIQQAEQSFCVSFAVIKDSSNEYLKHMSSQLRSCLNHRTNLINQDHLKLGINQKIPSYIYSKYRIFLIFDTKTHHDRILSIQSCFYPNVRFTLERIKKKKKQTLKFVENQVLKNIQTGQYVNDFGFLSLDSKTRLLMIQKDDPDLHKQHLIGVWVISSYPTKRTRKQFGKQDAIWTALIDYYTNPQVQSKVSIIVQNKGFLSYFYFRKEKNKIDTPEFYLFSPITQPTPKWSLLTKSQFINDWKKPYQIKIDFLNNTIMQQRQYSQFSDQVNPTQQIPKPRTQPIARQTPRQASSKSNKPPPILINQTTLSVNSNQGQPKTPNKSKQQEQDQKNKIIQQLKTELQKYKMKCVQLQTINKILMQEKLINNTHHMYQQPIMYYGQMPTYHYPMPYSQNAQTYPQLPQNQFNLQQQYKPPEPTSPQPQNYIPTSPKKSIPLQKLPSTTKPNEQINTQNEKLNSPIFIFPQNQQEDYTFANNNDQNQNFDTKDKLFYKKYQSYQKQQQLQQNSNINNDKQQQQQQKYSNSANANQKTKDSFIKKDIRNISFQDSFIEYHSDHEDQVIKLKTSEHQNTKNKKTQILQHHQKFNTSPQFKKLSNLINQTNKFQSAQSQSKANKNQQPIIPKDSQKKNIQKFKKLENSNELTKSKQIKNKQRQNKSPPQAKQSTKQKDSQKTYPKHIQSSNQSQQSEKQKNHKSKYIQKQKIQIKTSYKKPTYNSDDSDDSDEDSKFKQLKQNYLKK